jgi:hypothetical protein
LQELFDSISGTYVLVGATPSHPLNHNGTAGANDGLVGIAGAYRNAYAGAEALRYNDQSLWSGGKFELSNSWQDGGSHAEHRLGTNCDVNSANVPTDRHDQLEQIFADNNATFLREFSLNHWHLRF